MIPRCCYPVTWTGTSSGMHREFPRELTTSSAVNFPMTSARLRLKVVWTGLRSIRCTYSAARVLRTTFTINFVLFIVSCVALKVLLRRSRNTGEAVVTRKRATGFQLRVSQTSLYYLDDIRLRIDSIKHVFSIDNLHESD